MLSDATAEELRLKLRRLEPRTSQTLVWRFVEGQTREALALAYGIGLDAVDVKVLRALQAYLGLAPPVGSPEAETARATEFAKRLENNPGEDPLAAAALELRAHAASLRAALDVAAREEEASPERRREDRIRQALVALIILVVAYFYLRG